MILPSGGTDFGGNCSFFDTDIRFIPPAGIVQLPAVDRSYGVAPTATSVDPDTSDANDDASALDGIAIVALPVRA